MTRSPGKPPRFIAGAVCPECRTMDRIVLEEADGERRRRCVSCGYSDAMVRDAAVTPPTRFDRRREPAADASPVKIIDPEADRR